MPTYHIHINGIVQGVGFRPMVYQLAKEMQLCGNVKNGNDGVHVFFNASEQEAGVFFKKIKATAPKHSTIISSVLTVSPLQQFTDFSIVVETQDHSNKHVLLSPDTALCPACKNELYDKKDTRYRYAFITCTHCGPRYSIIRELPYERHSTAMQDFKMCRRCEEEYHNISDRRFFSQTNSCEDCGIKLSWHEHDMSSLTDNAGEILSRANTMLQQGKILAVKGTGGYLLLCDAGNETAIRLLRSRKHRPAKPFAVLYPGLEAVQDDFDVTELEKELLTSAASPVVLLYKKQGSYIDSAANNIAPGLNRSGIMLPYNPLLSLISSGFGKPLVATSANISGSPIIYKNEDALAYLFSIADHIISYNRDIIIPQDDSVVQITKHSAQQIILRRSRGYAPSFLHYVPQKNGCTLSMGAFLKSSFTLSVKGNVFVSQFLGSGENYESQQMYKDTLAHWLKLYDVQPAFIIADLHPGYFSTEYAIELAAKYQSELKFVQHHEAHFAAVLAENNLLQTTTPVLGVIWDGTGFGIDGNTWGGEFFRYADHEMIRANHFDLFPVIAGDKLATEPRIAALCLSNGLADQPLHLKEKFTSTEWNNYQALIGTTDLHSSSAGRIFDAVASLLGVCDKQSYEGEAAMYLQALAEEYVEANGFITGDAYFKKEDCENTIPTRFLIQGIMSDIRNNKPKNYIAAKFHYSMVHLIASIAGDMGIDKICFSGGVFQNALLTDWIIKELSGNYQLYFHRNLSSNDENISFGQMVFCDHDIKTAGTKAHQKQHTTHNS